MNIAETREKCKAFIGRVPRDILIIAILILASSASFGLGYLAGLDAGQGDEAADQGLSLDTNTTGNFVASKSGTKYYPVSCAGAEKISDANKVYFVSASVAERAGYTLSVNCK